MCVPYILFAVKRWSDGTPVNFVNWYPGEPNDMNTGEKCVTVLNGQMHDNNCNILRPFVCTRHDGPIVPVTTTPMPDIHGGCQLRFIPYENKCYLIAGDEADRMTLTQAKDVCTTRNSCIASIHSSKEHKFIVSQLYNKTGGLWIGLNNLNGLQQFDWADNSVVDYTRWASGEPSTNYDDIYTDEPCVEIVNKADSMIYWNDVKCHNRRGYICSNLKKSSIPPPTPPDYSADCQTGYVLYRYNCYRVLKEIHTWADSQSTCQQDGANLISIMDIYELNFATVLIGNTTGQKGTFWSGGKLYKDTLSWVSGETPTFRPNIIIKRGTVTDSALCILVYDDAHSKPANCDAGSTSICKMPTDIITTTVSTTTSTTNTSSNTTYPNNIQHVEESPRKGDDDNSGLTGRHIAGIVIGIIGVLLIISVAVYVIKTKYLKKALYPVEEIPLGFDNAIFNRSQETVSID